MANLSISINKSKQVLAAGDVRLELAKAALKRATAKPVYAIEDYTDGDTVEIIYCDQFGNFMEPLNVPREELIIFVTNHYRNIVDTYRDGELYQYIDNRSAADYLEENMAGVLKDFVNNRKGDVSCH